MMGTQGETGAWHGASKALIMLDDFPQNLLTTYTLW